MSNLNELYFRTSPVVFGGLNVINAPPPAPRIKVRDIRLKDGTPILSQEFLARINADLLERFGFRDDAFKDHAYIFGNSIVMSPSMQDAVRRALLAP